MSKPPFRNLPAEANTVTKSEQQLRSMYLSGTISIPPRFPDLAEISFSKGESRKGPVFVVAMQQLSPKLVIKRSFFAEDVTSLFVPSDCKAVSLESGEWFEGEAFEDKAYELMDKGNVKGIIYVREHAQSMLEVEAGLTAAESAEYYPPLPDDRSVNHYNMNPLGKSAGCN